MQRTAYKDTIARESISLDAALTKVKYARWAGNDPAPEAKGILDRIIARYEARQGELCKAALTNLADYARESADPDVCQFWSCENRYSGTCPSCYEATGTGCPHGKVCDDCKAKNAFSNVRGISVGPVTEPIIDRERFGIEGHFHARYIISVGDSGITLYSEDAQGQWDATGLNPHRFATVVDAAEFQRELPKGQTAISLVSRVSGAVILAGTSFSAVRWYSTAKDSIPEELRHVDAYKVVAPQSAFMVGAERD